MQHTGLLASLEGISGTGKTHLTHALKPLLSGVPTTFLTEVVDRQGADLDQAIIDLLASCGDRFFRRGRPRTETFLLLALKMFDYEARIAPALAQGHMVIEDRSIDTIAIYQALILCPESVDQQLTLAHQIYALASRWRRPPDITFLVEERFEIALARIEQREGCQLTADEIAVLQRAAHLYTLYARDHAPRIVSLRRQELSNEELLRAICGRLFAGRTAPEGGV
jgi:dTMP kinase